MNNKIGLCGASGRMGTAILSIINLFPKLQISGIFPKKVRNNDDLEQLCLGSDIVVDFSSPQVLPPLLEYATKFGNKLVIGTTGFNEQHLALIKQASKKIAVFYSANMSIGISLLSYLAGNIAQNLDENYDIDIIDTHHQYKKDQPSGTALMLQKAIELRFDAKLANTASSNKEQPQQHPGAKNLVNISSIRSGNIIGEHEIIFASIDEIITIKHQALDRDLFAKGALRAAMWMRNQHEPGFYSISDMLKFK